MKTLSEFLEVDEGVEFKFEGRNAWHKIEDNTLMVLTNNHEWCKSSICLNDIVGTKISIISTLLLTDEEREYLKAVVKIYKNIPIVIVKGGSLISIKKDGEVFHENYTLAVFDFTEEMPFKNMKIDREYRLKDLGLEE